MAINRRGFFGITAGAIAAGPSAAKGVVSGEIMATRVPTTHTGIEAAGSIHDDDWRVKRIDQLLRMVNGKRDPKEVMEADIYGVNADNFGKSVLAGIDGLRSVSLGHKHKMAGEAMKRQRDRNDRQHAIYQLLYEFNIPRSMWEG